MIQILVADDEELERSALKKIMVSDGLAQAMSIDEARNGREVLALADTKRYDAIFMDIKMPGIDGLLAAELLHDRGITSPIVILSAYDAFAYAQKAIRLGVYEYLLKPAGADVVLAALGRCLSYGDEMNKSAQQEKKLAEVSSEIAKTLEIAISAQMTAGNIQRDTVQQYLAVNKVDPEKAAASALVFRFQHPAIHERDPVFSSLFKIAASAAREAGGRLGFKLLFANDASFGRILAFLPPHILADADIDQNARGLKRNLAENLRSDVLWPLLESVAGMVKKTASVEILMGISGPSTKNFTSLLQTARDACELAYKACPVVRFPVEEEEPPIHHGEAENYEWRGKLPEPPEPGRGSSFEKRVVNLVRRRYMDDMSLRALAREMGLSPFHLSHKLASELGLGFKEILARTRVNQAKRLLSGGASIKEASYLVGYRDQAYFSRVFKKLEGQCPKRFIEDTAKKCK